MASGRESEVPTITRNIVFEEKQWHELNLYVCKKKEDGDSGCSISEIVRQSVDRFLRKDIVLYVSGMEAFSIVGGFQLNTTNLEGFYHRRGKVLTNLDEVFSGDFDEYVIGIDVEGPFATKEEALSDLEKYLI